MTENINFLCWKEKVQYCPVFTVQAVFQQSHTTENRRNGKARVLLVQAACAHSPMQEGTVWAKLPTLGFLSLTQAGGQV